MIDHVSLPVRALAASALFYDGVLGAIGYARLVERERTIGYGKRYAELWINARPDMPPTPTDSGAHVFLRARSAAEVWMPSMPRLFGSAAATTVRPARAITTAPATSTTLPSSAIPTAIASRP